MLITFWSAPAPLLAAVGDELFKLTASDGAEFDAFGNTNAVAISGNIALIGARLHEADGIGFSGAAYLYDVTTGAELAKLTQSDAEFLDSFGSAVGISGDRAVVGSFGSGDASENTGAAYLFDVSDPQNPAELHKLLPSAGEQSDGFGEAAAISGNTALVGATGQFINTSIGKAYLYDATTGDELAILSDNTPGSNFGNSAAISGNTALVGAFLDDEGADSAGAAFLFDISDPNSPVELHKLVASDIEAGDQFGWSVSISGNTAIVGSRLDSDDGNRSGSAYLFDVATGAELAKLTASDGAAEDEFGTAVSISGNTALIGANLDDDAGNSSGSAYLFDVSDPNNPLELVKLTASDAAADDDFGTALAIDAGIALVGTRGDNSDTGSAYVFSAVPEPSTWLLLVAALACFTCIARNLPGAEL
jgi:hypothetical protein